MSTILNKPIKGKLIKNFLLLFTILFFLGCQSEHKPLFTYKQDKQQLLFQIDQKMQFQLTARSFKYQLRHGQNVFKAFTLYDDINAIFIEHVQLSPNGGWNGQPRSVYRNFIKEKLRIKSMEVLDRQEMGNYEFTTYKINNKYVLYFVYIWESQRDTFIYDAKGLLYNKLIKKLNPSHNTNSLDLPNYGRLFNESLVHYNTIYRYFQ